MISYLILILFDLIINIRQAMYIFVLVWLNNVVEFLELGFSMLIEMMAAVDG